MRQTLSFLFILITVLLSSADNNVVVLNPSGPQHNHNNIPIPADMPDVYYINSTQTVIIDGGGEVNYYDVEIISLATLETEISTQVNGYYDTIDVSSLPDGDYTIFIYSPTGYTFDGDFAIY